MNKLQCRPAESRRKLVTRSQARAGCWVAALLWLFAGTWRAAALDPGLPPGSNFDLTHWYLGLPDSGASSISPALLTSGYTHPTWFYTDTDGAMTMWCPANGGTTSGSGFPRSELREMIDPTTTTVNWTAYGTHVLDAQCKIRQVPSTGRVVIGQIHAYLGSAHELIVLKLINGSIEAQVRNGPESSSKTYLDMGPVALNQLITYQIKLVDGLLTLTLNGVTRTVDLFELDPAWGSQTFYFKAGSYCQDNSGPATEGSLVSFYYLRATHGMPMDAPAIVVQPANLNTNAGPGATASFRVIATGTPPLFFQWHKDGTPLAGRTSALLTLGNVATNDAGGYHAVVVNAYGAATSAVATLTVAAAPPPSALAEAVEAPQLNWTTTGTPPWFAQAGTTHDGEDAAESGAIGHGKATVFQTTVRGPGTIRFWWRVSSQSGSDYLRFHLGGSEKSKISGEKNWQSKSFSVSSGTKTLKWTYSKNGSKTGGLDRAWLDQVEFIPAAAP